MRSLGRLATLGSVAVPLVVAATWAVGCEDTPVYVYSAQHLDVAGNCLEAYAPLDRVEGSRTSSTCPPLCLRIEDELYISHVCPPFPTGAELLEPSDPDCAAALQAPSCDEETDGGEEEEDAGEPPPEEEDDAGETDAEGD